MESAKENASMCPLYVSFGVRHCILQLPRLLGMNGDSDLLSIFPKGEGMLGISNR
jgi:hypothetical protein